MQLSLSRTEVMATLNAHQFKRRCLRCMTFVNATGREIALCVVRGNTLWLRFYNLRLDLLY